MASELSKIEKKIYRRVSDFCGRIYSDTAWEHVRELVSLIKTVEGVQDVNVSAGEYFNYLSTANSDRPAHRDYKVNILTDFGEIEGIIRCHSAGTTEDPFSRYDMTISLWHENMKRSIKLTPTQLNEVMRIIKEENTINISARAKDNNLASFANAANDSNTVNDIQQAKSVGDVSLNINGPKEDDSQPQQVIDVSGGESVQNAINRQGNDTLLQKGGGMKIVGDGFGECKVYTKQAIDEMRLENLNKGKRFTKQQLCENFMVEETIEDKIETLPISRVLKAYKAIGGNPQDLKNEFDIAKAIIEKYNSSTPELQELFMDIISD